MPNVNRRQFVKSTLGSAAALATVAAVARPARTSANDAIQIGLIGTGGRYRAFVPELAARNDTPVVAVCDVDQRRVAVAADNVERAQGRRPEPFSDYRRLLDDPSIDAVFIATTHHWHAPVAVAALAAGKDIYLEKPGSHVFREGRAIVDMAAKHGRIVQHGTQMRSSDVLAKAGRVLASGLLGDIKMAKAWNVQRRAHPGPQPDGEPPAGVDYDMWLGPAPKRPFNPNRFHDNWHAYRDYGNGDIGNDGAHDLDMARWGLGVETHPVRITAHGSRVDPSTGEREFPDNTMVAYQYADGRVLLYEDRLWTPYRMDGFDSGNAFYGTKGYMIFSRRGYFQVYLGMQDEKGPGVEQGDTGMSAHVADFLDCLRSRRQPNASAQVTHLSCGLIHLGEVACRVGRVIHFDPQSEQILADDEANALLTKDYRAPWTLPT
jgi:predicted dehydrogenase